MREVLSYWPLIVLGVSVLLGFALVLAMDSAAVRGTQRADPAPTTQRPAVRAGRPSPPSIDHPSSDALLIINIYYRTLDGTVDYGFTMIQLGDETWRVYITQQPGYGTRPQDGHTTHRLKDPHGRNFICWSAPIASYEDAKRIAALWAEATERYRKTGQRF